MICICNYGIVQLEYFKKQLNEFSNIKNYNIELFVQSTVDNSELYKNCPLTIHETLYSDIKFDLSRKHREIIVDNKDKFDYFIYTENDILLTQDNVDYLIEYSKKFSDTYYVPVLLRYEKLDDITYLIDSDPCHSWCFPGHEGKTINKYVDHNGEMVYVPTNPHQACFFLSKKNIELLLEKNLFSGSVDRIHPAWGVLETMASNVYMMNVLEKFIPIDSFEKCLIRHISNRITDGGSCKFEKTQFLNNVLARKMV